MVSDARSQLVTLNGERASSTYLINDSPGGGQETDGLVTTRPERLVDFICVGPPGEYNTFNEAFTAILESLGFKKNDFQ